MTGSIGQGGTGPPNYWRLARWTGAVALLLTPLVMMQISDEWHWTIGGFFAALWLVSATFFRAAAKEDHAVTTAHQAPRRKSSQSAETAK